MLTDYTNVLFTFSLVISSRNNYPFDFGVVTL